jgi:hypothetical protein
MLARSALTRLERCLDPDRPIFCAALSAQKIPRYAHSRLSVVDEFDPGRLKRAPHHFNRGALWVGFFILEIANRDHAHAGIICEIGLVPGQQAPGGSALGGRHIFMFSSTIEKSKQFLKSD